MRFDAGLEQTQQRSPSTWDDRPRRGTGRESAAWFPEVTGLYPWLGALRDNVAFRDAACRGEQACVRERTANFLEVVASAGFSQPLFLAASGGHSAAGWRLPGPWRLIPR